MIGPEQIYAHALPLAGDLNEQQLKLLEVLCGSSAAALSAKLRDGLTPDDCADAFLVSASLMALSTLAGIIGQDKVEQITAGDFTVKKGSFRPDSTVRCLQEQAAQIMAPYLKDHFTFMGV